MKKRGLSAVVTTLIIILLVLVAVGIVWGVIRNVISESSEQVSMRNFAVDLEVEQVVVGGGSVDVKVKRNPGAGNLTGLKFIISDGVNKQTFEEETTMQELGEQSFTLAYDGMVKEVSVAPVLRTDSGKEFSGDKIDIFELPAEDVVKSIDGLVSWWRFEGDAKDEVGVNDGTLQGGVDCNVNGKHGKACEFDGVDDYVDCGKSGPDLSEIAGDDLTIGAWIKPNELGSNQYILQKNGPFFLYLNNNVGRCGIRNKTAWTYLNGQISLVEKQWVHIVCTYDGTDMRIYIGEVLDTSVPKAGNLTGNGCVQIGRVTYGGCPIDTPGANNYFNGTIDEVMVFNESLSEDEVKALYELDLG